MRWRKEIGPVAVCLVGGLVQSRALWRGIAEAGINEGLLDMSNTRHRTAREIHTNARSAGTDMPDCKLVWAA